MRPPRACSTCRSSWSCTRWPTSTRSSPAKAAGALGFARSTADWRAMVADPEIDIVNITAPNALHKEMALAAIAAGKHVYCEKPLAPLAADAREMAEAAERAGVKTQVGFNYLCNPLFGLAREMIAAGELGEIRGYRGLHAEDYMADAAGPYTFRHDPAGGGALADIGSHALATAEFLLRDVAGPIASVMGDCVTMIGERPDGKGGAAAGRGRRRRPRLPAFRQRGDGLGRGQLDRHRPQDAARLRGLRLQGRARRSARSASTSCTSSLPPMRAAARDSGASRPGRTIRPTACSASRPATSSASTI